MFQYLVFVSVDTYGIHHGSLPGVGLDGDHTLVAVQGNHAQATPPDRLDPCNLLAQLTEKNTNSPL